MKTRKKVDLQLLAAEENLTKTTDLEPAISIDYTSRLAANINELQQMLGITDMTSMAAGTLIKMYAMTQTNTPDQVGEGEVIPLTHFERKLINTIELKLNKYRKATPAESIQKVGRSVAVNKTDAKLIASVQNEIRSDFFKLIESGTGTAKAGKNLQQALANAWAAVRTKYKDISATPIYWVSTEDLADYLGNAQVTMQTTFGLSYIENFLGLGTVIVTPTLTAGNVIATAKENLNGAYIPANSGDVAQTFGLTADATGLVGMTHNVKSDNATYETLVMSGVKFYPELLDGVIKAPITPETPNIGA